MTTLEIYGWRELKPAQTYPQSEKENKFAYGN